MNIAIIDADLIGCKKHRFPNLCCMKLSSYHKKLGDFVILKTDYDDLARYDKVYISKVFVKTIVPGEPLDQAGKSEATIIDWYRDNEFLKQPNIEYGGTGFYYDKAPPLPDFIEHSKPDYHLYDDWVNLMIANGAKRTEFKYYLDYSIGYLTRKCFRHCYYCVNRNYNKVELASPLDEFIDMSRPKLCFLDDNFFGNPNWRTLIKHVVNTGKKFQFRQGLDERLLDEEKIASMSEWNYDGDFVFAFDNIEDRDIIEERLRQIRRSEKWKRRMMFYVFCGCDQTGRYDDVFFENDISNVFERIKILNKYGALPYIMRFEGVYDTEMSSFYSAIAAWCNQPSIFYTFPFDTFCKCKGMTEKGYAKFKRDADGYLKSGGSKRASWRALDFATEKYPHVADAYFHMQGSKHK